MLLGARQFFAARKAAPLPYDYEVQYLESTGTQWLDTGIYPTSDIGAKMVVAPLLGNAGDSCALFCGSDSWRWGFGFRFYGTIQISCLSRSTAFQNADWIPYGSVKEVSYNFANEKKAYLDGSLVYDNIPYGTVESPGPIWMFGGNYNGTNELWRGSKMRVYSCQMTNNGVLVRDFIPVRVGSGASAVGYMYDRVSGTLFGVQGTGAFGMGPDVTPAFGYVQTGLVAMWDGIENAGWGTHDGSATSWTDLIGSVPMANSSFGTDYAIPTGNTMSASNLYPFKITGDFTLHGCLVNAPRAWYNSTEFGIGTGAGLENGFALSARDGAINYDVCYRKSYSGTVECKVTTGTSAGQAYSCDIVFDYAAKSYAVYVNGVQAGTATLPEGAWNLDNVNCSIGYGIFNNFNGMGGFKTHNILYYSRALTAAEIAANYAIDKQRFNLP